MDYKTLGTFEVLRDDEPVDLGSHKQQMLLALLLINANEVVSVDRILEEIWGDDAVGKKSVLQVYVSRLRSALEPQRSRGDASVLETKDPGYLLRVDPESVDASRFEHRIEQARDLLAGDPGAAAEQLSDALAMWSGAAFEQFEFDDFCRLEKSRLDELRVAGHRIAFEATTEGELSCTKREIRRGSFAPSGTGMIACGKSSIDCWAR